MSNPGTAQDVEILILGAGVCGIAAAVGCTRAGFDDFVIIERASDIGGTWHHNTYPGCAVDIPSHVYSFSYAPNPDWTRLFSPAHEVKGYLIDVARRYRLEPKMALQTELLNATWDEELQRWIVTTDRGVYRARYFVSAAGPLHEAIIPDLPGRESFSGQMFHSSAWPEDLDLRNKRVVVLGTGASAVQFVPAIQPEVGHMTVLQRTPSWVMPKVDWNISRAEKALLRRLPYLATLMRWALWAPMDVFLMLATHHPKIARAMGPIGRWHIGRSIKDKDLRKALTPGYTPTCKRLGLSNNYYQAFAQPNVELVTEPAAAVREHSVVTAAGREIAADVVIFGTGFHTLQHHPINSRIVGRGRRCLEEVWNGSPTAFMGTSVAGFPNAFIMFGPNVGTLSGFVMAEAQVDYLIGALREMRSRGLSSLDVRQSEQDAFVAKCDALLSNSTFIRGGCSSYYLDDNHRRASLNWPGSMAGLRRELKKFDLGAYAVVQRSVGEDAGRPRAAVG
jgi:cation diffusion facilitator CzcD-associated flavoprotein CzcO